MFHSKDGFFGPPFRITELLQLTHLGIPLEHITWSRVTMTSDQWICIRHSHSQKKNSEGGTVITILNMQNSLPQTFQANTSCSKMAPDKPLIALRADCRFQVYDLEKKKCFCRFNFGYDVHFWTWVNSDIIAIVSDAAVYHINLLEGDLQPQRMFFRDGRLKNTQLVHYAADSSLKWLALTGLYVEDNRVAGTTQILCTDRNICQTINAHCIQFASYQFRGNSHPSCVLLAASRGADEFGKLHIIELGPHLSGNLASTSHSDSFEFTDMWCHYDFPSTIQVSTQIGLVYVVTKYGLLYVFDLETSSALCRLHICPDVIFATALNHETQGIIAIARNGQVLSIDLKKEQLVAYVCEVSKRTHVADRLSHVLKEGKESTEKD